MDYLLQQGELDSTRVLPPVSQVCEEMPGEEPVNSEIVIVKQYNLWNANCFDVGSVHHKGDELQLVLSVAIILPNGERRTMKVLVDTGAQANLIRKGLIGDHLLQAAVERLNLRTANGQRLDGGEKTVQLTLGFRQVMGGEMRTELAWHDATFYEAHIRVHAILSFPWLLENHLGVFPYLKALATLEPEFTLLFGLSNRWRKYCDQIRSGDGHKGWRRRQRWKRVREVVAHPWDEEEEMKMQISKMRLHVDGNEMEGCLDFLRENDLEVVQNPLKRSNPVGV